MLVMVCSGVEVTGILMSGEPPTGVPGQTRRCCTIKPVVGGNPSSTFHTDESREALCGTEQQKRQIQEPSGLARYGKSWDPVGGSGTFIPSTPGDFVRSRVRCSP